ncbi:MAG: SOS response-associated peptidase [Burkholderiaceae bacterium]|nr:SOS response-associated peptidase [Burkholderiaceae bacterium]
MCVHYEALACTERWRQHFGLEPPTNEGPQDIWPGYQALFIRRPQEALRQEPGAAATEAIGGRFGLIPHWARDTTLGRHTYNARTETVAEKPSFRDAWRLGRRCIIPAEALYEPDWRSGRAVATRIVRSDGQPMAVAGLWTGWRAPSGEIVRSFSMLTVSAEGHAFMRQFHRPAEEKRMVVILPDHSHPAWLQAATADLADFLRPYTGELEAVSSPSAQPDLSAKIPK